LYCDKCDCPIESEVKVWKDTHHDYTCINCKTEYQWDDPDPQMSRNRIRTGPPQPCSHEDLRKPNARVPKVKI